MSSVEVEECGVGFVSYSALAQPISHQDPEIVQAFSCSARLGFFERILTALYSELSDGQAAKRAA